MSEAIAMKNRLRCAVALVAVVASMETSAHAQTAAVDGVQSADIIVTAQRRAERSQDVPVAITAFSPDQLRQKGINQPQDLQGNVPSLSVGGSAQSSRESQSYTLRGQGATYLASPGVVVYMNEVPLPSAVLLHQQGGPGTYLDLENIQVLAGPQGTLFGRNTTGGAILLVPHKPTNDFEGYVEGKLGNYSNRQIEGVVNIPVIDDKLLVRAAGQFQDRDGFTRDVTFNRNIDNIHYWAGRIGVTFRPSDQFENYLMGYIGRSDNNGTGQIHKGFNIPLLEIYQQCSSTPGSFLGSCDPYRAATAQADALGPRATAPGLKLFQSTRTSGLTNTTNFKFNDELTLRNIFSYQTLRLKGVVDSDGTIFQFYDGNTITGRTPPGYTNTTPNSQVPPGDNIRQYTEELQLQGDMLDHRLNFSVGGFYLNHKPKGRQGGVGSSFCPAAFTGFCPPVYQDFGVSTVSKAVYAQATLDLGIVSLALDRLKLTGGYRYTWDHITGFLKTCSDAAFTTCSTDISGDLRSKSPTWTIGLDYKVVPTVLLYGKISRGYKAGGFNASAVRPEAKTFEPEKVTNYEVGFKSDWRLAGMRGRLNASSYYLKYDSIQRIIGDFNFDTGRAGARAIAAAATIKGIEIEATINPISGVELGGNLSYTDAKHKSLTGTVTSFLPFPTCDGTSAFFGQTVDQSCIPFPNVPKWTYSFHGSFSQSLGEKAGTMVLFVNYSHVDDQSTAGFEIGSREPGQRLEGYGLLNASLDINGVGGYPIDAGLFVTNATNKLYRVSNSNVFGSVGSWSTVYGEPRMYGLRLRYRFGG